jgi:NAD(P)-dependent dehydrogenase (short-subunit alcohol dehydrogenase family)
MLLDVTAIGRTMRWIVRGLAAEMLTNILPGNARAPPVDPSAGQGRLAVVTGSTGGIGSCVAMGLAARGFEVCVAARNKSAGQRLVRSIQSNGGRAIFVELDLDARPAEIARALAKKQVALLVNNAGTMGGQVGTTLRVNLCGPAALTLALLPSLQTCKGGGRIVNVGSSSHLRAADVRLSARDASIDKSLAAYAQSKLGLMHLSLLLRDACEPRQIPICDCHPGIVWTPMLRNFYGERLCSLLQRSGAASRLFRTPDQGAATVLCACLEPVPTIRERHVFGRGANYWVNGQRNSRRAASPESRDRRNALRTWRWLVNAEPSLAQLAVAAGVARSLDQDERGFRARATG